MRLLQRQRALKLLTLLKRLLKQLLLLLRQQMQHVLHALSGADAEIAAVRAPLRTAHALRAASLTSI